MQVNERYMRRCIELARYGQMHAAPNPMVGAVIVHGDRIIGEGYHAVCGKGHAEVNAIRKACKQLDSFQLKGCDIYSSCEPCPMCLGAIYWARPDHLYYASTKEDAADGGFDDSFIYKEIALDGPDRFIPFINKREEGSGEEFRLWKENENKTVY